MAERKIKIFHGMDEAANYFASKIMQGIEQKTEGEFFTLALSGGTTPKSVFQYISNRYAQKIDWKKVRIFWGDERCVPPDHEDSNYKMANQFLLEHIAIPSENIFRICGECSPQEAAETYERAVRENVAVKDKYPVFDLFMLGIGPEGHTASIFPDQLSLFQSDRWFDVATHPQTGQKRITATGRVINNALIIIFIAAGAGKSEIVRKVTRKEDGWKRLPASQVQPRHGTLYWLLDEAAAGMCGQEPSSDRNSTSP